MRRRLALLAAFCAFVCLLLFATPFVLYVRHSYLSDVDHLAQVNAQIMASAVHHHEAGDEALITSVAKEQVSEARVVVSMGPGQVYGQTTPCVLRAGADAGPETRTSWCGSSRVAVVATHSRHDRPAWVAVAVETSGQWHSLLLVGGSVIAGLIVLPLAAVFLAERLGRSIVQPVDRLVAAAARLSNGDLSARVRPEGPSELRVMGETFNHLAGRVAHLMAREREASADLSHRLRTPVTALMLQAEALSDPDESRRLMESVTRLQGQLSAVIKEARGEACGASSATTDLNDVVIERVGFWLPLAQEQGRIWQVRTAPEAPRVAIGETDLAAVVDVLVENVLTHTPDHTPMTASTVMRSPSQVTLIVEDGGPGICDGRAAERGHSGRGSSGLGLDIARRTAESAGGRLRIGPGSRGGAQVEVVLPAVGPAAGTAVGTGAGVAPVARPDGAGGSARSEPVDARRPAPYVVRCALRRFRVGAGRINRAWRRPR
ncbi:sensor histidine kinase [Streptomyces sp. NPDC093589]|uniref:sensor histidine kinase n=1 Tax=Streptomyces sp. NPDC093589 TaxID=3366043 RepID=UPI0037FB9B62